MAEPRRRQILDVSPAQAPCKRLSSSTPAVRLRGDHADAAIELAARIPAARIGGAVEVRPVKEQ